MGEGTTRAERRAAQEGSRRQKALASLSENLCNILLVRHGETTWNVEHRLQGQLQPGPPLNELGLEQAKSLAARLAVQHLDAIYTSDLQRTSQTAELVQNHHQNLQIISNPELRERYLACLQGMTMEENKNVHPQICSGLLIPNEAANKVIFIPYTSRIIPCF